MTFRRRWILAAIALGYATGVNAATTLRDQSIEALQRSLSDGHTTSVALTAFYLQRIAAMNHRGPALHALIAVNPDALAEARASDRSRRTRGPRGPLEGIPVLIKDNIETKDPLPTTAGSLAMTGNVTHRDAPVVARLRDAGAIILGKTNLSEWANFRSTHSLSGWSAVGGLTRNPYVLDRTACGSSSGSAAAVAADFAAGSLGTETDGSITCPASMNGVVGLKPTVGLLSQAGIIPIAHTQDTAGPMGRSVTDAALLLGALTGRDYRSGLDRAALAGKRIGVLRFKTGSQPEMNRVYAAALARLRAAGATLIEVATPDMDPIQKAEQQTLLEEFKSQLDAYLSAAPAAVKTRSLSDLIRFDRASPAELRYFGQELFLQSEETQGTASKDYAKALAMARRLAGRDGIDRLLHEQHLDLLVAPTATPAWRVDIVYGDAQGDSFTTLAAVAGYPNFSVPMGQIEGLPVGLSFIGPADSEALLLDCGYAFEARSDGFVAPKFLPTVDRGLDAP